MRLATNSLYKLRSVGVSGLRRRRIPAVSAVLIESGIDQSYSRWVIEVDLKVVETTGGTSDLFLGHGS